MSITALVGTPHSFDHQLFNLSEGVPTLQKTIIGNRMEEVGCLETR